MKKYDYIIVGAGVAGLTVAYQLAKNKRSVLVIERDDKVGGLAKSFQYRHNKKKYIFDIGPKRFHTEDKEVLDFIYEILGRDTMSIGRKSSVYSFKNYFNWPIKASDLLYLPLFVQLRISIDLLWKLIPVKRSPKNSTRFDEYILSKYGRTLYAHFFKGYTEKFLGIPTHKIHADWASTGIDRSIIDKKAKGNSLLDLLKGVLLPQPLNTKFIYPSKGGFGYFTESIKKKIREFGVVVLQSTTTHEINANKSYVKTDKGSFYYGNLIWTGNLHDLANLLQEKIEHLEYLSTIFYNIIAKQVSPGSDQWIYFGDSELVMSRVSMPQNFARYVGQKNKTLFIAEKTCRYQDDDWRNSKKLISNVIDELIRVRLLSDRKQVEKVFVQPVRDTYPIYQLNYKRGFARIASLINTKYSHIKLLGRTGAFWYNNSDHSIKAALGMARVLLGETNALPDKDKIFSGSKD